LKSDTSLVENFPYLCSDISYLIDDRWCDICYRYGNLLSFDGWGSSINVIIIIFNDLNVKASDISEGFELWEAALSFNFEGAGLTQTQRYVDVPGITSLESTEAHGAVDAATLFAFKGAHTQGQGAVGEVASGATPLSCRVSKHGCHTGIILAALCPFANWIRGRFGPWNI